MPPSRRIICIVVATSCGRTEFRYLSRAGAGLMELDYLPSDKVYEDEHPLNDDSSRRWLFYWNHSGVMDQVWRFNVDYTKVSDPSYFNDFDNKLRFQY